MRFFADPHWREPKPGPDAIFTMALVVDDRTWLRAYRVKVVER
jgi:hypothetical protein